MPTDRHVAIRARLARRTAAEIVTMVHALLGTKDARDRFEAARHRLSLDELVDLATRAIEAIVDRRDDGR